MSYFECTGGGNSTKDTSYKAIYYGKTLDGSSGFPITLDGSTNDFQINDIIFISLGFTSRSRLLSLTNISISGANILYNDQITTKHQSSYNDSVLGAIIIAKVTSNTITLSGTIEGVQSSSISVFRNCPRDVKSILNEKLLGGKSFITKLTQSGTAYKVPDTTTLTNSSYGFKVGDYVLGILNVFGMDHCRPISNYSISGTNCIFRDVTYGAINVKSKSGVSSALYIGEITSTNINVLSSYDNGMTSCNLVAILSI